MIRIARIVVVLAFSCALTCCHQGGASQSALINPVPPPEHGAYLGAYVDPTNYVEGERIEAFEAFERLLDRELDIFHIFHTWADPFPAEAERHFAARGIIPLISWAGTDTRAIVQGRDDDMIRERARAVKALGSPVLLRWRWEMNRANLVSEIRSPQEYVAAWRHIHAIFRSESVSNVAWTWCPLAEPIADQDFGAYYPGDDVVDWICADGYARSANVSWVDVFDGFLEWAREVDKPILIGEFARATDIGSPESLARWLRESRHSIKEHPQVKALVYFNNARGSSGNYDVAPHSPAVAALGDWTSDPYFDVLGK